MRLTYAIVFVSDMNRSVAFYRDVVGLPLRFASPQWTEFDTEGATLALHEAEGAATGPATHKAPGRCRPGIGVPDLDGFHARMIEQSVPCPQPPTLLHGTRIAQYLDPDGLPISVSEIQPG